MRTISLWEPWASAIAIGAKKIETRSWNTGYRGPIAIHAAKTKDHAEEIYDPALWPLFQAAGIERTAQLPFGCVVATARIVDCVRTEDLLYRGIVVRNSPEYLLGGYGMGRFGWVLADVHRLPTPIPAKGAQGFWNWHTTKDGATSRK